MKATEGIVIDISEASSLATNVRNFLSRMENDLIKKCVKRALSRSLPTLQKETIKLIQKQRRLKPAFIKAKLMKQQRNFKSVVMSEWYVAIGIPKRSVGLIEFVKGSKEPKSQAGKRVTKRQTLKVEIKPGSVIRLDDSKGKGAFIAKGRGGNYHVFRRATSKSTPIIKQTEPGVHVLFEHAGFAQPALQEAGKRMLKEFDSAFEFYTTKEKNALKP